MLIRTFFTFAIFFCFPAISFAQHEWDVPIKNAASDMQSVLKIELDDQICISPLSVPELSDSLGFIVAKHFAKQLQTMHPQNGVMFPCADSSENFMYVTGSVSIFDDAYKTAMHAESAERINDWEAVFYLEKVPYPAYDSTSTTEKSFFEIPDLPAKAVIQRMSGHTIDCQLLGIDGADLVFNVTKKNGKTKNLRLHRSEVFSIIFEEGEWVMYEQDELIGDDFTEDEMRIFIAGAKDAIAHYNAKPTTYVGILVGAAGPLLGGGGIIVTIAPIIAYTLFQMVPFIKIKGVSNPAHMNDEIYALGYESIARSEKILGGLKGSAIGAIAGAIGYIILK